MSNFVDAGLSDRRQARYTVSSLWNDQLQYFLLFSRLGFRTAVLYFFVMLSLRLSYSCSEI